jgi:hypothetical protein
MAHYGDFNGDGLDDFAMQWVVFPHTLERESTIPIDLFINDGNNGYELFTNYTNDQHLNHMPYRMRVGKFNDDEYDDAVTGSMGVITRTQDGGYTNKFEPFQVTVSNGDGTYRDATYEVEGQEDSTKVSTFGFAHDIALGDVNGDGYDDVYQGMHLFFSDGDGSFTNMTESLPEEVSYKGYRGYIMSSEIADLNNDGFGDIIAMYSDCSDCGDTPSGYVFMSQGNSGSIENRVIQELPVGRYGKENTKFNYTVAYDVNLDGWLDIVSGITRGVPYYVGSHLQIFVNQQGEGFLDQTEQFVSFPEEAETMHGEGVMYVLDLNDDGVNDILHALSEVGFRAYLHDGQKLQIVDHTWFPHVYSYHLKEYPWDTKPDQLNPQFHTKAFPVNIDGQGPLDYISSVPTAEEVPGRSYKYNDNYYTFYSVIAKKPLRVRAPEEPMTLIDGAVADTVLPGNYFRVGWQPQEIVDAVTIQWSTDPLFESSVDSVVVMDTSLTYLEDLSTNTQYFWRLKGWNNMGSTSWTEVKSFTTGMLTSSESQNIPSSYSLRQNYPNPFNPVTQIEFEVPVASEIRLEVFDVLGRSVRVLADGLYGAGAHSVSFDASDLPSGLYMYRLTSADYVQTRSMQLVK